MQTSPSSANVERALKRLQLFFPGEVYTAESVADMMEEGDVFINLPTTLQYLQSALLDKKIIEVEINTNPRVFFTRVTDFPPEPDNNEERIAYKPNSYLENLAYMVVLPVEPGVGNHILRNSQFIKLRIFTALFSVELGTTFQEIVYLDKVPLLRLDFPAIGRIVRGAREYRAKVPAEMDLKILIMPKRERAQIECDVNDVSNSGISFVVSREAYKSLKIDDYLTLRIYLDRKLLVSVDGHLRHMTKMRTGSTMQFICGVQLDLESRRIATAIESLVARVQRAHLQEISQIHEKTGVHVIA